MVSTGMGDHQYSSLGVNYLGMLPSTEVDLASSTLLDHNSADSLRLS